MPGLLKRRLGCDFDRLHEHANTHVVLRQLLGCSEFDPMKYSCDQILRNVSLLDEDTLRAINELVVRHGQHICGQEADEQLSGRCDSLVVETDVHSPTDRNLLRDSARVMVRVATALAKEWKLPGWRQSAHHQKTLRRLYQGVASTRRSGAWLADVDAFLGKCEELLAKVEATRNTLAKRGAPGEGTRGTGPVCRAHAAPDRADGAEDSAGRDHPARGEGVLGLRRAYAVEQQGQGGSPGGTGRARRHRGRSVPDRSRASHPVGGKRLGCRATAHQRNAGVLPRNC